MEASSEMFIEQSLKFGVLCAWRGVGGKGTETAQPSLGQAAWGIVKRFSVILVFKSLWHFK